MERIVGLEGWKWKLLCVCLILTTATQAQRDPESLIALGNEYPRAFFFRQAEGVAAQRNIPYEQWERTFERLMGIEGKVLEEEVPGRSIRNVDFFTCFKNRHPDQLVLLHFNGNARDPRYESNRFFAGHWIYYNGARILSDVPAEEGQTDIRVDKPGLFKVSMGRYRDQNEDIGLCMLDAKGRPDWCRSEQVQLVSIDSKKKVIRVRRGCYGTKPRAFRAGASYAAAHLTEGPWGKQSHLLWYYNYSTRCPPDENGRVCADVLVEHFNELFGPQGSLAAFDGLEFDVLKWRCGGGLRGRGADCDADGKADAGLHDGVNLYGAGVVEFCRKLRERLGENTLILADGMNLNNQRAFGILNGIESEGWPDLRDNQIHDWSGGLNRHFFWAQNARPPVFNYINHKFNVPTDKPGVRKQADVPFSTHRLVFAVASLTNSAICYSFAPANDADGLLGVWDEFRMGTENKLGWLGKPLGPAVRMAGRQPDLLEGKGTPVSADLRRRLSTEGVRYELQGGALKVTAIDPSTSEVRFRLRNVPCGGPDLFVLLTARAEARRDHPPEVARLMYVGACPSGQQAERGDRLMTWVNGADFDSGFYFSNIDSHEIDLEFIVEGSEPVTISRIQAHAHPDAMYRAFERGLVVANPSPRPYVFDLAALLPGRTFGRLRGSPTQDAVANDGSIVAGQLNLRPKEGLFLIKRN
ncbi:MAG: hypothetical protein JSW66_09205 [Phycisphaerales bacterium]|nr:MAG: hypothetical protein JSW66_09205 [Phycisphaerales bacterium]